MRHEAHEAIWYKDVFVTFVHLRDFVMNRGIHSRPFTKTR
jgi:hypothetical protein